jgi:hypothetical protein
MVAMIEKKESPQSHLRAVYGSEGAMQLTLLIITLVCTLIMATISLIALYKKIPVPKYFSVTPEREFFKLPPENEPSLSQGLLQNWVTTFALASHTFDFYHFDEQASVMEKYFTSEGYRQYMTNIEDFRSDVMSRQMMMSCTVMEAPLIRRSTVIDNIYEWYVEVPIIIRYDSASTSRNEKRKLVLIVRRYPDAANPYGVAVSTFRSIR